MREQTAEIQALSTRQPCGNAGFFVYYTVFKYMTHAEKTFSQKDQL